MSHAPKNNLNIIPPFRVVPESTRRIMVTQLLTLGIIAVAAIALFGGAAIRLILVALAAALATELVVNAIRADRPPGSVAHSLMMGLLVAFTLPTTTPSHIAVIGSIAAVLIGKHFFGGLGHYLWHPALVGALIIQLFFGDAVKMAAPIDALRNFDGLPISKGVVYLGQYLMEKMPPMDQCLLGTIPGGIGETGKIAILLVGCYFLYRGYCHWQLPAAFILTAYVAAALCPIILHRGTPEQQIIYFPIVAEDIMVGLTYVNYHILTDSLLLAAVVFTADMASRPMVLRGQILFGVLAGALAIVFRLYTPIPMPCYAALLAVNTLTPLIDRHTRPR